MAAGIEQRHDDCAIQLDKVVNCQIAFRDERPVIIVELHRKDFGIERDSLCRCEIPAQKSFAGSCDPRLKIVIHGLQVFADRIKRDDGQALHDWRRIDLFSSGIESVFISPRL